MNYQILKIKLYQIIECIKYYTDEPSVKILIKECDDALFHDDVDIITYTIKELLDWYNLNINKICDNSFVHNKEVHKKNVNTLNELLSYIKSDKFEKPKFNYVAKIEEEPIDKIIKLVSRFHLIARQLRYRHDSRKTLDINDEYDVQDLLHALLYLYFDDVRDEEWCPSYAGKSSRQDFLLNKEMVVIEVKKTRCGLSEKDLSDQLIVDISRYKTHPKCKTLICFVYDPEERIKNPAGIEGDLTSKDGDLKVIVKIIQR